MSLKYEPSWEPLLAGRRKLAALIGTPEEEIITDTGADSLLWYYVTLIRHSVSIRLFQKVSCPPKPSTHCFDW